MHTPRLSAPSRKTLLKVGSVFFGLVVLGKETELVSKRQTLTSEQIVTELFSTSPGEASPDTSHLLYKILAAHPKLGPHSEEFLARTAWQLHTTLGQPKVSLGKSYVRCFMPRIGQNHYDALHRTCYIAEPKMLERFTELPHVYQHNQEGIVILTADLLFNTLGSWTNLSRYDSSYKSRGLMEHEAHEIIEPALAQGVYSAAYGDALLEDIYALPMHEQAYHVTGFLISIFCQNNQSASIELLRMPAFQKIFKWIATEGRERILEVSRMLTLDEKSALEVIYRNNQFLCESQKIEWNNYLYKKLSYMEDLKVHRHNQYLQNVQINPYVARQLVAVNVAKQMSFVKNYPWLTAQIDERFTQFVKIHAEQVMALQKFPTKMFLVPDSIMQERLEGLFVYGLLLSNVEMIGKKNECILK